MLVPTLSGYDSIRKTITPLAFAQVWDSSLGAAIAEGWASLKGYSQTELDDAQARWGLRFPPDLVEALLNRRPLLDYPDCFDWITAEQEVIKERLAWPFEGYWSRVRDAGYWWPEWGEKPASASERRAKLGGIFADAPKLIPLCGHRYIPEEPRERGIQYSRSTAPTLSTTVLT